MNGILLYQSNNPKLRDFGFAPYETFKQGIQESGDFAKAGLARVLEHTKGTAENLKQISSLKHYKLGINI